MERSNSIPRGKKRIIDLVAAGAEGGPSTRKRPFLASVIVEALAVDALQKLFEPTIRKVVREEVGRAFARRDIVIHGWRSSPKQLQGPNGRNLQLQFRSTLPPQLFTGGRVEGEHGAAIDVVLLDANNGYAIASRFPESSMKLDVVVLEGGFHNDDDDNWSEGKFENYVVKGREGRRPLLTGDIQVVLKEGKGTLGQLTFTDNSSWTRSGKFRLGVKLSSGYSEGIQIRGAKTEAFTVRDHRGELYKKHYPPALHDEVWRLEKIHKNGKFHKRLNDAGIFTVQEFLQHVIRDSQNLRTIVGNGMSKNMWGALIEHARTCELSGKHYVYYPDDTRNVGVVFNIINELSGLLVGGQYCSADSLSHSQKDCVDSLVEKAYANWIHVTEYESDSLVRLMQHMPSGSHQTENVVGQQGYLNSFDQVNPPFLPASVPSQLLSMESDSLTGDHVGSLVTRCPRQAQNADLSAPNSSSLPLQNPLINTWDQPHQFLRTETTLVPGPSKLSDLYFQGSGASSMNSFRGFEDFFLEEEGMRSQEMLGNDITPLCLHGGGLDPAYANATEDGSPFSLAYQFRPSVKAVVRWLKLKAALRWGIFIRKKVAERHQAQLVELDWV